MVNSESSQLTIGAIVPITNMAGKLQNLSSWLNEAVSEKFAIYLIHDIRDRETSRELQELVRSYKSSRINLIEGHYGSPGAARNAGLNIAEEDWIFFWDSDDIPMPKSARRMLESYSESELEVLSIIVGQFTILNQVSGEEISKSACSFDNKQNLEFFALNVGLWRCAIKRKTNTTNFNQTRMGEDQYLIARNIETSNIAFSTDNIYKYFTNVEGQLTSRNGLMSDLWKNYKSITKIEKGDRDSDFRKLMTLKQLTTILKNGQHSLRIKALGALISRFFLSPSQTSSYFKLILRARNYKYSELHNGNVRLLLTGGLGNQLFQIAAALSTSGTGVILANETLGKPRLNSDQRPDSSDFEYPFKIESDKKKFSWLMSKASGYALRSSISPAKFETIPGIQTAINASAAFLLSFYFGSATRLIRGNNVGFSEIERNGKNSILVGYFQSYRYVLENNMAIKSLKEIRVKRPSQALSALIEEAKIDSPIVVHIRLGDYLSESDFGIPGINYYLTAIKVIQERSTIKNIWVFSDDIASARKRYGDKLPAGVKWVEDNLASSSETLELMRHGSAFVIANSTFSWWAATLSHKKDAVIVAPSKWFKNAVDPKDLIPSTWIQVDPDF